MIADLVGQIAICCLDSLKYVSNWEHEDVVMLP